MSRRNTSMVMPFTVSPLAGKNVMRLFGATGSKRVVKPDWKKLVANGRWYQSESPSWTPSR